MLSPADIATSPPPASIHDQRPEQHSNPRPGISSPVAATTFTIPRPSPVARIQHDNMGRLPALTFGRYMLHDDFVTFLRDFLTVANAYNAPDHYRISQFRSCLQGDARDLFESRIEPHTLNSWSQVQALAHQLFVPTDQHNTTWDYITTTKFRHGDNLDLHFSKFVKNAKIATNSQGEFMKQTARIHFITIITT